jgi:hypothetical protein
MPVTIDNLLLMLFIFMACSLAAWRVSRMFVWDNGPFHIFQKIRDLVGVKYDDRSRRYGETWLAELFACMGCMSVWIGLLFGLIFFHYDIHWYGYLVISFGLSTVAMFIDRFYAMTE